MPEVPSNQEREGTCRLNKHKLFHFSIWISLVLLRSVNLPWCFTLADYHEISSFLRLNKAMEKKMFQQHHATIVG
jgi:hypothetical protein